MPELIVHDRQASEYVMDGNRLLTLIIVNYYCFPLPLSLNPIGGNRGGCGDAGGGGGDGGGEGSLFVSMILIQLY